MSRKVIVLAIAALSLVPAVFGASRDASAASLPASRSFDPGLAALFAPRVEQTIIDRGMLVAAPAVEFFTVVKRAEDGSLVITCVNSAAAAAAFLDPNNHADPRMRKEK